MAIKYNIAAAALRTPRFTVADLAETCGVGAVSVRTVLTRLPEDWFDIKKVSTGARGGQPSVYELTEEGRRGFTQFIGELPALTPSVPVDTSPVPLGLASARELFDRLASEDSPSERATLADEAIADLNAAAIDAADSKLANLAGVLVEVDSLKARFNAIRGMDTTDLSTQRAARRLIRKQHIQARSFGGMKTSGLWPSPHDMRYQPRALPQPGLQRISQRIRTLPLVLVSYLAGDMRGRDFASYAVGAFKTVAQLALDPWRSSPLSVEKLELEDLLKVWELRHGGAQRPVKVFVCFDSKGSALDDYRRSLEHAGKVLPKASTTLCDLGFSRWTKEFAQVQGVHYSCNLVQEDKGVLDLVRGVIPAPERLQHSGA